MRTTREGNNTKAGSLHTAKKITRQRFDMRARESGILHLVNHAARAFDAPPDERTDELEVSSAQRLDGASRPATSRAYDVIDERLISIVVDETFVVLV